MGSNQYVGQPRNQRLEIRLNVDEHEAVKRLASRHGRTLSDVLRTALRRYLVEQGENIQPQAEV